VSFGFVYGSHERYPSGSPEIDIVVYDASQQRPVLRDGDIVHVLPQTVRGIIQVKKRLTKPELRDGIRNVAQAKDFVIGQLNTVTRWNLIEQFPRIFSGVVGITDNLRPQSRPTTIQSRFADPVTEIAQEVPAIVLVL
jgi:hypothetical protein